MKATGNSNTVSELLLSGIDELKFNLREDKINLLIKYVELFAKWNNTYNLSAVRDPDEMVSRHILDSLSIAPFIASEGERFIDVGTGGGLPGIPLAIVFPDKQFTLLDSNGKKTRFLFQVKLELELKNITIENTRIESYQPEFLFDGVMSRAFASVNDFTRNSAHLLQTGGKFYAMKGTYPSCEVTEMLNHFKIDSSHVLQVPGCEAERHLIVISRVDE